LVDEPWRREYGIPFDMRAPLTPDIAVQVLPVPFAADLTKASIRSQPTKASLARIGSFLAVPSNSSFLGKTFF
jgi:hypothetical protein